MRGHKAPYYLERLIYAAKKRHSDHPKAEIDPSIPKRKRGRPTKSKPIIQVKTVYKVDPNFSKQFVRKKERVIVVVEAAKKGEPIPDKQKEFKRPPADYSNNTPYGIAADYLLHPDKYEQIV